MEDGGDGIQDKIVKAYEDLRPRYSRVAEEVSHVLSEKVAAEGIRASISRRSKETNSLRHKISRKNYANPLDDIADLAGVRVVCDYESDLSKVGEIIRSCFAIREHLDKSHSLGVDKMGYHGAHFVLTLGDKYSGGRYDDITTLRCEVQVRTVLQDAWATISQQLVYKNEAAIPERLRRDLNNVASLLEIAQGIFDTIKDKRHKYLEEITKREAKETPVDFLSQGMDFETVQAYARWKFPQLPASEHLTLVLLQDINPSSYLKLSSLDTAVKRAELAVEAYRKENPNWFKSGMDFITKSLGFVDPEFRMKHGFAQKTREAFKKYDHLVRK